MREIEKKAPEEKRRNKTKENGNPERETKENPARGNKAGENRIEENKAEENLARKNPAKENKAEENRTKKNRAKENNPKENPAEENKTKKNRAKGNNFKKNTARKNKTKENTVKGNQAEENKTKKNRAKGNNPKKNPAKENIVQETKTEENTAKENTIKENNFKENKTKKKKPKKNQTKKNQARANQVRENKADKNRSGKGRESEAQRRKKLLCDLVQDKSYIPMKEKELASLLQVSREEREEFRRLLGELLAEGKLAVNGKGRYQRGDGDVIVGTFLSSAKGYGFVETEESEEDLFIPEEYTGGAFHKDKVQAVLLPSGRKGSHHREARVIRILERGFTQVVGTYERTGQHYGFVTPDLAKLSQDIFIPEEHSRGAVNGHKVVVELTDYGGDRRNPEGRVVEILGHVNDPGVDILSIVKGYELPVEFDSRVMEQAERVAKPVSAADRKGRRDLRDVVMVTIDGEDAKDLDDAVSLTFDGKFYYLGVHIADVSNYVQEHSALDREALKRGTSVYLVDRVIPMLPHTLSNGICSLNAGEERLALSCLMKIDRKGEIVDHEITESVVCVDQRMSYTAVKNILEDGTLVEREKAYQGYASLAPMFREMRELSALLRRRRKKRGSIDFDFPECRIVLDENGHPTDIRAYERNVATDIIEDFMLAANETVAQHFHWLELPFLYRVHDVPDPENIEKLSAFIRNYGYSMKLTGKRGSRTGGEEVHPREIQKLLARVAGTPEEPMISRLALRSMKQARYSVNCTGHFGLACRYYCHFTSPIRRYPDLQIHRIIKEQLRGRMKGERPDHYRELLPEVAKRTSDLERRADEAERETDKLKKVEYMEGHLGEEYDGVISGVTRWGIYVELPNTVEGLVHVTKLPGYDRYVFREESGEMVGTATGRVFRLGMPVRVKAVSCDRVVRTIDFDLVEEDEERGGSAAWQRKKKRRG